jgi:hypothetical protein
MKGKKRGYSKIKNNSILLKQPIKLIYHIQFHYSRPKLRNFLSIPHASFVERYMYSGFMPIFHG